MHTIKLRGPWQIEALESASGELPPPAETTVPGDWTNALGSGFRGRARYTRRFGLPTNLAPEERVFLVVGVVDREAEIVLNGQPLGQQIWDEGQRRYVITQLLKPRNELQINVGLPGGLLGEVRLEIE
jgi:hypothetical protein